MNELIKIEQTDGQSLVSARELHEFFGIKTRFTQWIKRMFSYGFIENVDYSKSLPKKGKPTVHNKIDYALTIDCAKQIAMLQRSDKGKEVRQYFVNVERKFNQLPAQVMQLISDTNKRLDALEAKAIEAPNSFTVTAYARINGYKLPKQDGFEQLLGRRASKLCRMRHIEIQQVPNAKWGYINAYPSEILAEVFQPYLKINAA